MPQAVGLLRGTIDSPGPCVVVVSRVDAEGRAVSRRRIRAKHFTLTLPVGRHMLVVEDDRALRDPTRFAGSTTEVVIEEGRTSEATLPLHRGSVVRAQVNRETGPARFARVQLVHGDGAEIETRADSSGRALIGGLRSGQWTVLALDSAGARCSSPASVEVTPDATAALDLDLHQHTGSLLVTVGSAGHRELRARFATVVEHATRRRLTVPLTDGMAHVRGLIPGSVTVALPPSPGHCGAVRSVAVTPGSLNTTELTLRESTLISGRVVQEGPAYAASVALIDEDGREIERTRTDSHGRFVLGRGLINSTGLTVVATSGPETMQVTKSASTRFRVTHGAMHDLGDLTLPVSGRPAAWTSTTPATPGMRLPSTRV